MGDYKPVAGVMYPHSINTLMNGQAAVNIIIDSIEPGVDLADDFFKMPPPPPQTEPAKTTGEKETE